MASSDWDAYDALLIQIGTLRAQLADSEARRDGLRAKLSGTQVERPPVQHQGRKRSTSPGHLPPAIQKLVDLYEAAGPGGLTNAEVKERAPKYSQNTIRSHSSRARRVGKLEQCGVGRYRHVRYHGMPIDPSHPSMFTPEEEGLST